LRKDDGVALRHVVGVSSMDLCTVAPGRGKRKPWWNAVLTSGAQDGSTDPHGPAVRLVRVPRTPTAALGRRQ
jgi:hypothetical protein